MTAILEVPMASEKDSGEPSTRTMRVPSDILAMLDTIKAAAHLSNKPFNQLSYVAGILRPVIAEDFNNALDVMKRAKRKT